MHGTTMVAVVAVVVVAGVGFFPVGEALKCLQCNGEDNSCKDNANMTAVPCGGTCYWKLDISREFDVRRCHPFLMHTKPLSMNNNMEDECYCNYDVCNIANCSP